jgi:hypothetical protein
MQKHPCCFSTSSVQFAIADRKLTSSKIPLVSLALRMARKIEYNIMGRLSNENITSELLGALYEESIKKEKIRSVRLPACAWHQQVYNIQTTPTIGWFV